MLISLAVLCELLGSLLDRKARLDLTILMGSDLDGCLACPSPCPDDQLAVLGRKLQLGGTLDWFTLSILVCPLSGQLGWESSVTMLSPGCSLANSRATLT